MKDIRFQEWIKTWWMLLVPVTFATVAVLVYAIVFRELPVTESPGAWGTFGDFLGGLLNPLVSTLTLFVAVSVWKLQREELELTRNELAQTKLAMEDQAQTTKQQRQEQRFFDLFNVYQRTVDSIFFVKRTALPLGEFQTNCTGKHAIAQFIASPDAEQLRIYDKSGYESWNIETIDQTKQREVLVTIWNKEIFSSLFDHYFRVIHHILTEAETLLKDEHIRYINLFRTQLSRSELFIIGFNLWLNDDAKQMIPLFEKYCLLKHLPAGHLRTELEKIYPLIFGNSQATEKSQSLQSN